MKHTLPLLAALLLAPVAALYGADSPSGKPNVIIVLTDDQSYGDLSGTGNPVLKTPHMDRLAAEGVSFANFHLDAYCTPTRSALITGRYCHRVGDWGTINDRNMLRDEEVTMADVFRHNGYRTGHFGKWHLGSNYPYRPIGRGFDEWLGHGDGGTGCTTDYWGNDRVNDHYLHNGRWESKPRPGFECDVFFVVMGTPRNETGPNPPPPKYGQGCAVMTDRWRWVKDRGLYDLTNDPRQEREIAGLHPEVTTESRKALCSGFYVSVQNSKET